MTDKPYRDRERILMGKERAHQSDEGFRTWLKELLPDIAPSPEEREEWLTGELIRARRDYIEACQLAFELYLAGMGQTRQTFTGVDPEGPVAQVQKTHLPAALHRPMKTRNVSPVNDRKPKDSPS